MNPDQANASYGLPSMSSIYSNIKAPSLSDIGGSLGDKAGTVNTGVNNAFQNYQNFAGSLTKPTDYYSGLLQQNGIPQLQKTSEQLQGNVNDLENSLYRITPNVTANTSNSLVTNSQREGMIAAQSLPIQQLLEPLTMGLGQVNTSLATQEANIGHQVDAMNTGNQQQLDVGQMGVTAAMDNAARSMTGYTADADNQLQGLLKKMDITGTLDAAEWQTLSTLASQKQQYQNQLGQIAAQRDANIKQQQAADQFKTVPAGSTLLNTLTGGKYRAY